MVSVLGFSLLGYLTSVFAVHPIVARYHSSSIAVLVMLLAMAGVIGVIVWYTPDSARIRRPPLPNGAIRILPNG